MPRYANLTDLEWNTGIEIFNEWPGLRTTSLKPVLEEGFPDLTSKMRSTYIKNLSKTLNLTGILHFVWQF